MNIKQFQQKNPELVEELVKRAKSGESLNKIAVGIGKPRQWVSGVIQELGIDYDSRVGKPVCVKSQPKKAPPFVSQARKLNLSFIEKDQAALIIKKLCDCSPLSVACMAAGVAQYDLQEWKDRAANREPEFAEWFALIAKAQAFAMEGLERQMKEGGPGWQGAQAMLKALLPEVYDPKSIRDNQRATAASALRDTPTQVLDSILAARYGGKSGPSDECGNLSEFSSDFGNLKGSDAVKEGVN